MNNTKAFLFRERWFTDCSYITIFSRYRFLDLQLISCGSSSIQVYWYCLSLHGIPMKQPATVDDSIAHKLLCSYIIYEPLTVATCIRTHFINGNSGVLYGSGNPDSGPPPLSHLHSNPHIKPIHCPGVQHHLQLSSPAHWDTPTLRKQLHPRVGGGVHHLHTQR